MNFRFKIIISLFLLLFSTKAAFATGTASTHFNIYLPPNNDAVQRNVCLIVTAIYDSTAFTIIDDGADGDTDDSVSGTLAAGQSYILYIKDNGINDDAQYASGGVLKRDGDYFFINSSKLVFASMSTDSDWQHDFLPGVTKDALSTKFIVYAPKISGSPRDLNVFAFSDSTTVTISKISTVPTLQTGYTNINLEQKTIVKQRTLNKGQDIIHFFSDGRDVMNTGATYMIETNKPVSVQYGALWGNARDGGGYVPSSNGSSSGDLFYFAVPYQSDAEQEIRVVSFDNSNNVVLERYQNGSWIQMKSWNLNRFKPGDWIGKSEGNATYPTVFRISCTPGKKVSVFECNWMETGSLGTSDMASMVSSEKGTDNGKEFLVYLLPPSNQQNVVNPFTGNFFGGQFTHCYLYAGDQVTTVTVKDAKTNGTKINRTYVIQPNRYVDAIFSVNEWKSIYNGNGNPNSGSERPYIFIQADQNISVMNSNTNDNWMLYFGSSLEKELNQTGNTSTNTAIPGDTVSYGAKITTVNQTLTNPSAELVVGSGGIVVKSELKVDGQTFNGTVTTGTTDTKIIFENLPNITPTDSVKISANIIISPSFNNGNFIPNNTIITVESTVKGMVDSQLQQTAVTCGIQNNSANQSKLLFSSCVTGSIVDSTSDSWNSAWIDYNNDGKEDVFVANKNQITSNLLYKNNGSTFTQETTGPLFNKKERTIASAWGDFNNDGYIDVFIVNGTGSVSRLYRNVNGNNFVEIQNSGIAIDAQYFHGAAWFDMDNDGLLDLIITNFFETKFHHIYKNNGNQTFTRITDNPITQESNRSTMPALADYNNDGLVDVFIPNGDDKANSLFKNIGNGKFEKVTNAGSITTDLFNSVGASWGDYNNDGFTDLFVLNASKQPNQLYKNLGNGTFSKVTNTQLTDPLADTHNAVWIDHDNDGDLDIFITNDNGSSFYYINNGNETFTPLTAQLTTGNIPKAMGAASADFNRDGKVDLFVATHSGKTNKLFCNITSNTNNFLNIRLVGTASNKSAIGAKIKLTAGGVSQYREVLPVQGIGSQNSLRQHFGLGNATIVTSIEIKWPSGYTQTITNQNINQFITITEESSNKIQGFAFHDANNNCIWDNNEQKIDNIQFKLSNNSTVFTTRQNGAYEFRIGKGSNSINVITNSYWEMTCSASFNFITMNNTQTINLPLKKKIDAADLAVTFGNTAWRRGFKNESILSYKNQGSKNAINCALSVTYPSGVVLKSANIPWTEKSGNTYTWNIAEIEAGKSFAIKLTDSVTLSTSVGQILPISSSITTTTVDTQLANNNQTLQLEIVGAIDPNDLLVSPKGYGVEGYITKDQTLNYHVRFQNVGTYAANRVVIENQLPSSLDWSTLKIESSSHENYEFTISPTGLIKVIYNDINLVDSNTNEALSHGFLIFSIKPKKDLMSGNKIENFVHITFDYEDAIKTNSVLNTINFTDDSEMGNLTIFPNPPVGLINIVPIADPKNLEMPILQSVKIINIHGEVVLETRNELDYQIKIDVSSLSSGVYSVVAYDNNGKLYRAKLVKP